MGSPSAPEPDGSTAAASLDWDASDVVVVTEGGAFAEELRAKATAVGARSVDVDLAVHGPAELLRRVAAEHATVVEVPPLLGRWLTPTSDADLARLRQVVLRGDAIDRAARRGIEQAFGAETAVVAVAVAVAAPQPSPAWVAQARLAALPGVGDALVEGAGGRSIDDRAWLLVADPSQFSDQAALDLAAELDLELVVERSEDAWSERLGRRREPSDDLERSLCRIAGEVLGRVPAVEEDLVERGIDADAALALVDAVDRSHGLRLRAGELLDHRTLAQLAAVIRRDRSGAGARRRPVVVTLSREDDDRSPLLLLHEADGSPFAQVAVAGLAGGAVVGFGAPELRDGRSPFRDLGLLAMRYLVDLRQVQPEGPYRLAGRGFGGAVAYEMARQLTADGAEVASVVVADVGPKAVVPKHERTAVEREHDRLLAAYRWPPCPGLPVVVGWSRDVGSGDATMGWEGLVGPGQVEVERLAADHDGPRSAIEAEWGRVLGRLG